MSREGWVCPTCKRGVSPDVPTCDHGGGHAVFAPQPSPLPRPIYPLVGVGGPEIFAPSTSAVSTGA